MELEQKVEEQTVVEVNGKKIDLSRIGNERVAQALNDIGCYSNQGYHAHSNRAQSEQQKENSYTDYDDYRDHSDRHYGEHYDKR